MKEEALCVYLSLVRSGFLALCRMAARPSPAPPGPALGLCSPRAHVVLGQLPQK